MLTDNLLEGDFVQFPFIGLPVLLNNAGSETACYAAERHRIVNRCRHRAGSINRHWSSANCELLRGCYNRKIGLDWQKSLFYAPKATKTLVLMVLFRLERGISDTVRSTLTCTSGSSDAERRGFCFSSQPIKRLMISDLVISNLMISNLMINHLIGFLEVVKVGVSTSLRVNNNKSWKL